ncbi:MAG: NHLP bacteriocin system secretion protein [Verrucomicrobiae bacterium]|nr:NHLP bacteriocin system secretion protein [Verrucomicrobiae bacterium]
MENVRDKLFRKAALERLSSAEQVDQLLKITTPKGWVALLTFCGLLAVVVGWGILGSIPIKVTGKGILIRRGGVYSAVATGSGRLSHIEVKEGDRVRKGQLLAVLDRPDLEAQIRVARENIEKLQDEQDRMEKAFTESREIRDKYSEQQKKDLSQVIADCQDQIKWYQEKMDIQEKLVQQGLLTKTLLAQTKNSYYSTQQQLARARSEITKVDIDQAQARREQHQNLFANKIRIQEARAKLVETTVSFEHSSQVICFFDGRITEVMADAGKMVNAGDPIVGVQSLDRKLTALIYIPSSQGKKVVLGMEALIEPMTIQQEEFGYIKGMVKHVSDFPATTEGMMAVLENKVLVQELCKEETPIAVEVSLYEDADTRSGYSWTSRHGPPLSIESGTMCNGLIVTRREPPYRLLIPKIKKFLGL